MRTKKTGGYFCGRQIAAPTGGNIRFTCGGRRHDTPFGYKNRPAEHSVGRFFRLGYGISAGEEGVHQKMHCIGVGDLAITVEVAILGHQVGAREEGVH